MEQIITINIIDNGIEKYQIRTEDDVYVLGRRYDNNAVKIKINKPETENDNICTMVVSNNGNLIDYIVFDDNEKYVTSSLSKYSYVDIGFVFTNENGYIKGSEIKRFEFLSAQKPNGFIPVKPEQHNNINYLIDYGFVKVELISNILKFYRMDKSSVDIELVGFSGQEQSDLSETDSSKPSYVKNKKLSFLENDAQYVTSNDLNNYVEKEKGKGLSSNDFSDDEKIKLQNIQDGANKTIVDASVSNTSENAIQNKVIKKYVDDSINSSILNSWEGEY